MRTPAALHEALRSRGYRVTPQRRLVFQTLRDCDGHPTAEEVHRIALRTDPGISLATIYNTLETLLEMGEIETLRLADGVRRYDPNHAPHHHARCLRCGDLRDVPDGAEGPAAAAARALDGEFLVTGYRIEFIGFCPRCREAGDEGAQRGGAASLRRREPTEAEQGEGLVLPATRKRRTRKWRS
jgi:Fe2+ or Zn2+ uptake regulation protein